MLNPNTNNQQQPTEAVLQRKERGPLPDLQYIERQVKQLFPYLQTRFDVTLHFYSTVDSESFRVCPFHGKVQCDSRVVKIQLHQLYGYRLLWTQTVLTVLRLVYKVQEEVIHISRHQSDIGYYKYTRWRHNIFIISHGIAEWNRWDPLY